MDDKLDGEIMNFNVYNHTLEGLNNARENWK